MDLKEFISTTLKNVLDGVDEARKGELGKGVGTSNNNNLIGTAGRGFLQDHQHHIYTVVDFDVAVTASTSKDGKLGVRVFGVGADGSISGAHETVSRVKLSVPVRISK